MLTHLTALTATAAVGSWQKLSCRAQTVPVVQLVTLPPPPLSHLPRNESITYRLDMRTSQALQTAQKTTALIFETRSTCTPSTPSSNCTSSSSSSVRSDRQTSQARHYFVTSGRTREQSVSSIVFLTREEFVANPTIA